MPSSTRSCRDEWADHGGDPPDCAHRYESHEPATAARDIEVSLTRVGACTGAGGSDTEHDTERPTGREMAGLEEIDYDARSPTTATVKLHFRDPALVEIRQGGDPRSVRVVVTLQPGETSAPAPAQRAPQQPVPGAPVLSAEQQARVEARLRGLAAPPPTQSGGGDFVINLASSTGSPDPSGVPASQAAGRQLYLVEHGTRRQDLATAPSGVLRD